MVQRDVLANGSVKLSDGQCSFVYVRPRPGVVVIRISGYDHGQFGTQTVDELREDLSRFAPVELFVDVQDAQGPVIPVQEAWTEFFSQNRSRLKSVSMLVRSKFMHVTTEVVKLFSRTGDLIRIYLDPTPFNEALSRAAPNYSPHSDG